jgi:hypothetical protein
MGKTNLLDRARYFLPTSKPRQTGRVTDRDPRNLLIFPKHKPIAAPLTSPPSAKERYANAPTQLPIQEYQGTARWAPETLAAAKD